MHFSVITLIYTFDLQMTDREKHAIEQDALYTNSKDNMATRATMLPR